MSPEGNETKHEQWSVNWGKWDESNIWFGDIGTFWALKIPIKNIDKIHKDFWTLSNIDVWVSLLQCPDIPKLYIVKKKIQKFWDQKFLTKPSSHMSQNVSIPQK